VCKKDCHLATMTKESYSQILKQIETKALNEVIDFFRSLPLFNHWTRRGLSKLQFFFQKKIYKRGNIIYRSGETPTHVYLVKNGQFEVNLFILFDFYSCLGYL